MAIADMIPTLDDAALESLRDNAARLSQGAPGPKTDQAIALLPLVETELAVREAAKPPKVVKPRGAKAKAAALAAEEAQAAEDAEEAEEAEVAELA